MARCRKRRICSEPVNKLFVPADNVSCKEYVTLSVDEYESIRLIDKEGLNQEECSVRLGVARTTAQLIYNTAREKLADCIVNGKGLSIEGGNYELCDGSAECPGCSRI